MATLADPPEVSPSVRVWGWRPPPSLATFLLGLLMAAAGIGVAVGIAIGHGGEQPASARAPLGEAQAVALVVGEVRQDGTTFDSWYRARLDGLAPGIRFTYGAVHDGTDVCGFWKVYAEVIAGPGTGQPANAIQMLNKHGSIATVDELSGRVLGMDTFGKTYVDQDTHCPVQAPPEQHTWLDDFRAGATP